MDKQWYHYLSPAVRPWAKQSLQLLKQAKQQRETVAYDNYDYIVFPLAKAYETFLKDYLYAMHVIDEYTYNNKRFAIGRALNPDVRLEQRDDWWLYDDLAQTCGERVAREVWDTWLMRNKLMHLYPGEKQETTLAQAEEKIQQFIRVIELCAVCGEKEY